MLLELGTHTFDVSTQALVVATSDHVDQQASALVVNGHGDDLVANVARTASSAVAPLIAVTEEAQVADNCLRAGASAIDGGLLADPALLPVIADAAASVVIADSDWVRPTSHQDQTPMRRLQGLNSTVERARWAEAAGVARSRIVVMAPVEQVGDLAAFGYVVAVATSGTDETSQGKHVAAVMAGARVICSNQVQATKRTVRTVAELLTRRHVAAPASVEFAGSK